MSLYSVFSRAAKAVTGKLSSPLSEGGVNQAAGAADDMKEA